MKQKQDSLNLAELIMANVFSLFSAGAKKENYFPKTLGRLKFKKILRNKLRRSTLGIYEYGAQRAIVKTYQGQSRNMDYIILKNEVVISKLLNKVLKRIEPELPPELRQIKLPKILNIEEIGDNLYVISEFIDAVSLSEINDKDQIEIYFKVVKFLKFLGDNMTPSEKSQISKREARTIIRMYPFLALKSILFYPSQILNVFYGILVFAKLSNLIYKLRLVLSHRDLHFGNILVSKKSVYVIDLEYTLFAPELFEEFTTLRYEWRNSNLRPQLLDQIKRNNPSYKNMSEVFRVVALNVATHSLSANNFPANLKKNYLRLLNYALKAKAFEKV